MIKNLARPGDLLFYKVTPSTNLKGKLIGLIEKISGEGSGKYYHVSILDASLDNQLQATFPKTNRSVVDWSDSNLELWRIRNIADLQVKSMTRWAAVHLGEWYGIGRSLRCVLRRGRLEICTQFVIDSALAAQIHLEQDSSPIAMPDELAQCKELYRVG